MKLSLLGTMICCNVAFAETRDELDRRYNQNQFLRPVQEHVAMPTGSGETGFSAEKIQKDRGLFYESSAVAKSLKITNYLHVAFSCSEKANPIAIPARFKKVAWKIVKFGENAEVTSGEGRTDGDGHFVVVVDSNTTDLAKAHFEYLIGGSILNLVAGDGPYFFDSLGYGACTNKTSE